MSALLAFVALAGCGGSSANNDVEPWSGFAIGGLTLHVARMWHVPNDHPGGATVVGVDVQGQLVRGWDLYARVGTLAAPELAGRGLAILMARAGQTPLAPGAPLQAPISPEHWTALSAPTMEAGGVAFWVVEGEMHPELVRVWIDPSARRIEKTRAEEVLHPPQDPVNAILADLASAEQPVLERGLLAAAALTTRSVAR